ncbi:MAG TPA: 23S rRNA (guanosine(2251)-2'-O)-methyltransferase RlmB [Candidatus Dormibacteraeota bacterium]|jgi:23S rRNA (guanosine2251-2'-O)-methyltransferase|nr:23S rRNA (guanosine(2251)-2'-O)-methyltransferase RlmB [Candidatus Dormibacteraeota bacterium]
MREIARYEQRQQRPSRPGMGMPRPGMPRPGGGAGFRPQWRRPSGQYQQQIRRVTAGPPSGAPESSGEPIAGTHAVLEALRSGRFLKTLYVAEDRSLRAGPVQDIINEAQVRRVRVNFVDKLDLARVAPVENHQGIVGIFEPRAGVDLEEVLLHLDQVREPALVLVVDSLQDPQNFGVLLRSAEGAGVHGVVVPRHRQVGTTAAVAKTSAGASEHLLVADVVNLRQAIDEIKAKGLWVIGSADDGELYYDEVDYRGPTAIVVGGEGEGMRRLVREACDQVVRIPMKGKVGSLNAAAAGTVLLFEAQRQRIRDVAPSPRREIEPAAERRVEEPVAEAEEQEPETSSDESLAAPPEELES